MKWYILCILIGILLYLIFNNVNRFSIGIPKKIICSSTGSPYPVQPDESLFNDDDNEFNDQTRQFMLDYGEDPDDFEIIDRPGDYYVDTTQRRACATRLRHRTNEFNRGEFHEYDEISYDDLPETRPGTPIPEICPDPTPLILEQYDLERDFKDLMMLRNTCRDYRDQIDTFINDINPALKNFLFESNYWNTLLQNSINKNPNYDIDNITYTTDTTDTTDTITSDMIDSSKNNIILGIRINTTYSVDLPTDYILILLKYNEKIYLLIARRSIISRVTNYKYKLLKKLTPKQFTDLLSALQIRDRSPAWRMLLIRRALDVSGCILGVPTTFMMIHIDFYYYAE